jgi:hypothetical protein
MTRLDKQSSKIKLQDLVCTNIKKVDIQIDESFIVEVNTEKGIMKIFVRFRNGYFRKTELLHSDRPYRGFSDVRISKIRKFAKEEAIKNYKKKQ